MGARSEQEALEVAEAARLELGDGWIITTWQNNGWHALVRKGCVKIHLPMPRDASQSYSAWIEPGVTICTRVLQIIAHAETASDALGFAVQDARTVMTHLRYALEQLNDLVDDDDALSKAEGRSLSSASGQEGGEA